MKYSGIGRSAFYVAILVASSATHGQEAQREDVAEPIDSVTIIGRDRPM